LLILFLEGGNLRGRNPFSMQLALLQYDAKFGQKIENLDRVEVMLTGASFDLAVLPELFATGYLFTSKNEVASLAEEAGKGPTSQLILQLCKAKKAHIVFGMVERAQGRVYNSAILAGPRGIVARYRKLHLFYEEKRWFSPGNLPLSVTNVHGARVGMMICFDWRFPETARTLAVKGADIIAHPSNLVLPHCPDAMMTRALENGVFVATADRTGTETRGGKSFTYIGQSEVVDPFGKILFRMGREEEGVRVIEIDPKLARKKRINRYNDVLKDRRPRFYS